MKTSNVFSNSNMFSGSNVFNKVEPNINEDNKFSSKSPSERLDESLTKEQLEEFRQMMLGDKVIIGCDEVIEMYEDEEGLLECLVYLWQQQSQKFRLNLPLPIREWFLSKFESTSSKKYRNLAFYKGMHFKKGSEVNLMPIDASGSFITSTTIDYELAKKFSYGFNDWCLKDNQICCVYKITGDLVFDVQPYRDFGEEEYIIYNPKFELIEILN